MKQRAELRCTRYRKSHDPMGRGWITLEHEQPLVRELHAFRIQFEQAADAAAH